MASSVPPVKNAAFTFYTALVSVADTDNFKTSPTLAAGDIKVSKDGGNFANIGTLPTQVQTTGVLPVALTSDEMNADIVCVLFVDAAGDEWQGQLVTIHTATQTLDTTDAAVDSRAAAATALTNAIWTDAKAGYLDVAVSSRNATTPPTVVQVRQEMDSNSTKLANLDAAVSTRSTLTAADVWGYATRTLTSLSALVSSIAAAVWAYVTRTLTTPAATVSGVVSAGTITIKRGDSLSASLTGLGSIAARTKLWFTIKANDGDADTASIVQIEETAGLIYINGAVATTAANGDITVDDPVTGAITIVLDEVETAKLSKAASLLYDVQMKTATAITTLGTGLCHVTGDVTRAVT